MILMDNDALVLNALLSSIIVLLTSLVFIYFAFRRKSYDFSRCLRGNDKVALVTGGANGLGRKLVSSLLQHGISKVIILDVCIPQETISDDIEYIECDVGDREQLTSCLERLQRDLEAQDKYLSIVINNAGIDARGSIIESKLDINHIFSVNVFSHFWVLQAVVNNHLKKHKSKPLYVVAVSSVLGYLAPRNLAIYSASKAALTQLYEGLYQEINEHRNIGTLLVAPGQLDSKMFNDVAPSNRVLAPILSVSWLAERIVLCIENGTTGVFSTPLYGNLLPVVKSMPQFLQQFCRWASQMDTKISPESSSSSKTSLD